MPENEQQRLARYNAATNVRDEIVGKLENAYDLFSPTRNTFFRQSNSDDAFQEVFDSTGINALKDFANNMQFVLMPPGRRWATLISGEEVPKGEKQLVDEELQEINKLLFTNINSSNLDLAIHEAFKDMGISTGVLLIQETPNEDAAFNFVSVPPATVAFEQNFKGDLQNFWRKFKISAEEIKVKWPKADLSSALQEQLRTSPHGKVELIEGTIEYPLNKKKERILYYVQTLEGHDIVHEFRDYNPWIGFRFDKSPIDVWGTGPGLSSLATMMTLNRMVDYELRGVKYSLSPPYLAKTDAIMNLANLRITPDSIIPIKDINGLKPLQGGGNVQFSQLVINEHRSMIKEAFFSNPLTPDVTPNQTATEISIRQSEWIRRSTSSFGRLTNELLRPIIEKTLTILTLRGDINREINIDNKDVGIKYQSPVAELQSKDDLNRFQQWVQALAQFVPAEALAGIIDIPKVPLWTAERFGVDLELLKTKDETKEFIADQIDQQQELQQEQLPQDLPQPLRPQTDPVTSGILPQ